ncbi:acyl-CoA dehydrogenase-like protein [Diplocarpon rosae]|nr:acyl-CoA dehydrogenase-like protein [Diplocarpon rosae]
MSPNPSHGTMNFDLPSDLVTYLSEIDNFIATSISPLQASNDNERFFDHRREHARTDWHNQGLPRDDWEDLLAEARISADKAGFYRFCLPEEFGGQDGGNLWMTVIRMHLAKKGLGLFNDLQNEHSIVGNFPDVLMVKEFGTEQQKKKFIGGRLDGKVYFTFGLTEPNHGSDATHMYTRAEKSNRNGIDGWSIDGAKMWISGMHRATHCLVFARTGGKAGDAIGITAFFVPKGAPGFKVKSYEWTFNMPTDHASLTFTDVFVPNSAILGQIGYGLPIAQTFVHENRLRQAASSLGAAEFCIEESIKYARERRTFGKELSKNQGIQFPIVELATQAAMLKLLILKTATEMDATTQKAIEQDLGDKVSMCNVNKDP